MLGKLWEKWGEIPAKGLTVKSIDVDVCRRCLKITV